MSKSAVYAGLGQGLMAFGQGASKAVETVTLEQLRQNNIRENWAREDKLRNSDIEIRQSERAEDQKIRSNEQATANDFTERRLNATESHNKGLTEYRTTQLENQKAKEPVKDGIITDGEYDYRVQYNSDGKEIKREIVSGAGLFGKSDKLPEKTKVRLGILESELTALLEYGPGENEKRVKEINSEINNLLGVESKKQTPSVTPAPAGALKMLKDNPSLKEQFKAKYGYLPTEF